MWQDALLRRLPTLSARIGVQRGLPTRYIHTFVPPKFSHQTPTQIRFPSDQPNFPVDDAVRQDACFCCGQFVREKPADHTPWAFLVCHRNVTLNPRRHLSGYRCRVATKRGYDYGLISRGYSYCR